MLRWDDLRLGNLKRQICIPFLGCADLGKDMYSADPPPERPFRPASGIRTAVVTCFIGFRVFSSSLGPDPAAGVALGAKVLGAFLAVDIVVVGPGVLDVGRCPPLAGAILILVSLRVLLRSQALQSDPIFHEHALWASMKPGSSYIRHGSHVKSCSWWIPCLRNAIVYDWTRIFDECYCVSLSQPFDVANR